LSFYFRLNVTAYQQQRLSSFLENYFSDATEKKSSGCHNLNVEGAIVPNQVISFEVLSTENSRYHSYIDYEIDKI